MIESFKHNGLKKFFEKGDCSGIQSKHEKKIRLQLSALDTATVIEDVDLPGYNLHQLKDKERIAGQQWLMVIGVSLLNLKMAMLISLRTAAFKLNVSPSTFSRLVKGEADISPQMALRLSKAFGRTPESWMLMQSNFELWKVKQYVNLDLVSVIYAHHRN